MSVIEEIAAERRRQIEVKGWTPEHDDRWNDEGQLADAAASYALDQGSKHFPPSFWPWPREAWKPTTRRRDLIKAAALILAAIEQIDRAAGKEG